MSGKHPSELLKKKVTADCIKYKFKWSNNSISIEPMTQLTPEMLVLVQEYELKQLTTEQTYEPKTQKQVKIDKFDSKVDKQDKSNLDQPILPSNGKKQEETRKRKAVEDKVTIIQDKPSEKKQQQDKGNASSEKTISHPVQHVHNNGIAHQERSNKPIIIKSIKNNDGQIELQIEEKGDLRWYNIKDLSVKSPISVCDYLLGKVKFGGQSKK